MPAGRPSEYRIEFSETAHRLAQQGATDREIAEALDIAESTLYLWRHTHPEFLEALKLGKEAADDRVESALYHRAIGYRHDAIKIMQNSGQVIIEPYVEHVPPDIGAIKLWLTNRRPDRWREKQVTELTGKDGAALQVTLNSSDESL